MRIRESGMPYEEIWEKFFDVQSIFSKLGLTESINDAAEFGAGYGTFSVPASKIIKGALYAYDIDEQLIEIQNRKIKENNLLKIKVIRRDIVNEGTGLKDMSVDYVMLFNILHAENPLLLLNEAYRILKENGKAGIVHWIYSRSTPRGPSLDIRPKPEQCIQWLESAGFELESNVISLPPYHYGLIGIKKDIAKNQK